MHRNDRGFTLLEIIIALTVLSTVILTLVQMFSGGLNQAAQADRYLNAVHLAQQKLEQQEFGSDEIEFQTVDGSKAGEYQWELSVEPYDSPVNDPEAGIEVQKIAVRVFWQDRGIEKEVELVTLKTLGETHIASPSQLLSKSSKLPAPNLQSSPRKFKQPAQNPSPTRSP